MTQTLIEKLEALPRYDKDGYKDSHGPWVDWIEFSAIIEDAKAQPDIVAELVKALEVCVSAYMVPSSNHAATTKKLIAKAKEMMG